MDSLSFIIIKVPDVVGTDGEGPGRKSEKEGEKNESKFHQRVPYVLAWFKAMIRKTNK
jgi:hypothetical protein